MRWCANASQILALRLRFVIVPIWVSSLPEPLTPHPCLLSVYVGKAHAFIVSPISYLLTDDKQLSCDKFSHIFHGFHFFFVWLQRLPLRQQTQGQIQMGWKRKLARKLLAQIHDREDWQSTASCGHLKKVCALLASSIKNVFVACSDVEMLKGGKGIYSPA